MSRSAGLRRLQRVADGLHQMRLAESHPAVQEQRIVGFRGLLGDGQGRGVRELIRGADDKRVEGVARVELISRRIEIQLGLRRSRRVYGGRDRSFRFGADEFQMQLRVCRFRSGPP